MRYQVVHICLLSSVLLLLGCGAVSRNSANIPVAPAAPAPTQSSTPQTLFSQHIWVVGLENHSYEDVVGYSGAPYFNSLFAGPSSPGAIADQYYADRHSSLCAIMRYVAGADVSIDPNNGQCNNDTLDCFDTNNIIREMKRVHPNWTWASAQEDLPYPGFSGLYSGSYMRRHNPLDYFSPETCHSTDNMPYGQFLGKLPSAPPNFVYITPNSLDDAHDGSIDQMDHWLSSNLPALLALPAFQPGGDGLLFLVFDEGNLNTDDRCSASQNTGCGGRVATVVIGPQVRKGFHSTTWYNHESLLRTMCGAMHLLGCPGAAAQAKPMEDMFLQPVP